MKAMPPGFCDASPRPNHARPPSSERSGRIKMRREQVRNVAAKQQRRPGNQTRRDAALLHHAGVVTQNI